jgi:hypothetical protein
MKTSTTWKLAVALVAMTSAGGFLFAPAAYADRVKDCGPVADEPPPSGKAGFTQTETQTAACNSASDQGEELGPVTNRGGGTPKGQQ